MEKDFIASQITEGEVIENKYSLNDGWDYWLLTNKRIIRYKIGTESIFEDLDYKYIISIRLLEVHYYWLLLFAGLSILAGWAFLAAYDRTTEITILGYGLILLGIILAIAAFYKDRKCEIIAHNVKWITGGNPRELSKDIRNHM